MARAATSRKPFICDVPAKMLRRNKQLSKGARMLHGTMRGLANGRTGELAIRGNPLDWKFIAREAEIGRDQWQRLLRELLAAGYVTRERERVEHYANGRRRVVLGRARYFVHKQPKPLKKPSVLLMPDSPTVEESGTQVFSKTPYCQERSASPVRELKAVGEKHTKSSSGSPATPDDDFRACSLESKANPFLTKEDSNIIRGVRENLARDYAELYGALKLGGVSDEWFAVAMNYIESRGYGKISAPIPYFTRAFVNVFANLASGVSVESDETLLECINAEYDRNQQLLEKFMPGFTGPTLQTEEHRRAFVAMNRAEVGEADSESAVLPSSDSRNTSVFKSSHDGERIRTGLCQQEVSKGEELQP
jgi:hypothetical protein